MKTIESKPIGEEEIVRRLADELPRLLPNLKLDEIKMEVSFGGAGRADLTAKAKSGNLTKTLVFEVKSLGEPRIAQQAISQLRQIGRTVPGAYLVFAAPYIGERSREICKSEGIGFVDLLGDAYLEFGSVLIDRTSASGRPTERRSLRSLFAKKSTRVIRALLQAPSEPTSLTKLAAATSMSLAGVYFVVDRLETKGFVTRDNRRLITVTEPRRLLLEWAQNWSVERSRVTRCFSFEKSPELLIPKISDAAKGLGLDYALTGMAGASMVAPFVRYDDIWFYVDGDKNRFIEALDLRPVSSGANAVILEPYDEGVFMGAREITGSRVVSDIQLFVDLYAYPARGQEQAMHLMEKAIKFPGAK